LSDSNELTVSEASSAGVISVVHHISDGIRAAARAGITSCRATSSPWSFRGSVIDVVVREGAAILESMVQAGPVPDFMSHDTTGVSTGSCSASKIMIVIDDAVEFGIGIVVLGEGGITGIREVRVIAIGVDVQGLNVPDPVLILDRSVDIVTDGNAVNYIIGLGNSPNSSDGESESDRSEIAIDNVDGVCDNSIVIIAVSRIVLVIDHVPVDLYIGGTFGQSAIGVARLVPEESLELRFELSDLLASTRIGTTSESVYG